MEKKYKNLREFWGEDGVKRVLDLVKSKEKELKEKELELELILYGFLRARDLT